MNMQNSPLAMRRHRWQIEKLHGSVPILSGRRPKPGFMLPHGHDSENASWSAQGASREILLANAHLG
ncbi:MAG: hypothetical protein AB7S86_12535 [Hydrogenophaga sp.]|uniref:hypothetical protein n=1 Tax=Hydrogenophaga sp. TaxID=1904254 RepID=UPI003D135C48